MVGLKGLLLPPSNDIIISQTRVSTILLYLRSHKAEDMINTQCSNELAIAYKDQRISYNELFEKTLGFAALLEGKQASKIALFSENIPEWIMAFYAAWHHDLTVVPIDYLAPANDVAYILNDCQPEIIFHSKNTENVLEEALKQTNHQTESICIDRTPIAPCKGKWHQPEDIEKTALIIYTSGTTGSPKGVMLSYANIISNVKAVSTDIPIFEYGCRVLLVLPLQHVFPLIGAMVIPLTVGGTVVIAHSLQSADIIEVLQTHKITLIIGVPRLYELIYKGIINKVNASPITRELYRLVNGVKSPRLGKTIFKKVHTQLGGHLKTLVSGGAALPTEVGAFYYNLGFSILEGYGMTEAAPMISFTHPGDIIVGCAGKTMSCLEVKIKDGEITAKGKSIMQGYYNRPEETAEVLKDGWLHTGDLGYIDDKSRLYITGRKKEIIVLSNGKNINPSELEDKMISMAEDAITEVGITQHDGVLNAIILPNFQHFSSNNISNIKDYFSDFLNHTFNPKQPPYKQVPKFTIVTESLPRTRLSKIQRFKLNEILINGQQERQHKEEPDTKEYKSIKEYLANLVGKDVYADSHLVFDLALDSLAKLELIDYIERTFGLTIKEEDLLNYNSFGELAEFITGHKEHFKETNIDWHEMMTKPVDVTFKKPWWTLTFAGYLGKILFKTFFKSKRTGLEEIPEGAAIIAPNHSSFLDAFLVIAFLKKKTLKDTFFYGKKEHLNTAWRRLMARHNNIIIMDLEKDLYFSIQQISQVLREGKKLIIFPEGTRSHNGKLGDFKTTFSILSKNLNVPIYPVAIKGAYDAWPRQKKMPILGSNLEISFLPAIEPNNRDEKIIANEVKEAISKNC